MTTRLHPKRDRVFQLAEEAILAGKNPSTKAIADAMGCRYDNVKKDLRRLRADGKLPRRMKADFLKAASSNV